MLLQSNHYYNTSFERCVPCDCYSVGSESLQCDASGTCHCKPRVGGKQCNMCGSEFGEVRHV